MSQSSSRIRYIGWTLLCVAMQACTFPGAPGQDLGAAASQTLQALATIAAGTLQAGATEAVIASDTPAPTASPSSSPTIVHLARPTGPGPLSAFLTDRSSQDLASEHRSIADNFNANQLERPFTSQAMDYQPYLDLTRSEWSASGVWYYVTLQLVDLPPADAGAVYGVEVDLDQDGRGVG